MEKGYAGQILRVDLTNRKWEIEALDMDLAEAFIGGRGLGGKILFDELDPGVEPLSPENKMIFLTGPLTATGAPTGCRYMVVSKSPLTGAIGYANSGGQFGAELKSAGYDGIIFEGKASDPVYLLIKDDAIEIKPASHLWGKTVRETEDLIKADLGDKWIARETQIAVIGPAGEKLVRIAAIMNGSSAAARTGMGAVMGSKNLKAIAVRGTKGVKVADGPAFRETVNAALVTIKAADPIRPGGTLPMFGTQCGILMAPEQGTLPTRNFNAGVFEGLDTITPEIFANTITIRGKGCFSCPIGCKRVSKTTAPGFEGHGEGPEYETLSLFGPGVGVNNPDAIAKAGFVCNEMGLDTISTAVTIACAMDLYERGFLPKEDVGHELHFGDAKAVVELTRKIGLREGFGDILAEGAYRLAERYGHPEVFIGAKKMEMPAHHARGLQAMGLAYATSNRGACHNSANMAPMEMSFMMDNLSTEGKVEIVKGNQEIVAIIDSTGLCVYAFLGISIEDVPAMLNAATGFDYTLESLLLAGERIWNQERLFNLKVGFTKADDTVSRRMLEDPMPEGPAKGSVLKLAEMLPEYYQLRGWDENGVPTQEKLEELGLE